MPEQTSDAPDDDQVESVPLDLDEGEDRPVEQENTGRNNMSGSGEWPSPDTPPTGPASGERGPTHGPPDGTASQPDQLQTGESGVGTPGAARLSETDASSPPQNFKDVLEQDPVLGGSSSVGASDKLDAGATDDAAAAD